MAKQPKITFLHEVQFMPVSKLVPAPWNYKTSGDEDQLRRFEASLTQGTVTPFHAAECAENPGQIEVFDGVHRLAACKKFGVSKVPVYLHGALTKAQRQKLSLQYNGNWFGVETSNLARCLEGIMEEDALAADALPFDAVELDQALAALQLDAHLDTLDNDEEEDDFELPPPAPSKPRTKAKAQRVKCPKCAHRFNL